MAVSHWFMHCISARYELMYKCYPLVFLSCCCNYFKFLSHIVKSESWIQSFKFISIINTFFSAACHSQERLNQSPKQWHYNAIKCNNSFPCGIPHQNEFVLAFILIYSTIFEKLHMNIHFQWKSNDYYHFVDRVKSMRSDEHKFIKKIWFNCIEVHHFMILQENPSVDKCNYMVWKICFLKTQSCIRIRLPIKLVSCGFQFAYCAILHFYSKQIQNRFCLGVERLD